MINYIFADSNAVILVNKYMYVMQLNHCMCMSFDERSPSTDAVVLLYITDIHCLYGDTFLSFD